MHQLPLGISLYLSPQPLFIPDEVIERMKQGEHFSLFPIDLRIGMKLEAGKNNVIAILFLLGHTFSYQKATDQTKERFHAAGFADLFLNEINNSDMAFMYRHETQLGNIYQKKHPR